MKIAILLIGHFRTFDLVKESFNKNLIQANPNCEFDIYIHTWESLGYSSVGTITTDRDHKIHQKLIEKFGLSKHHNTNSPILDVNMVQSFLNPVKMIVETDDILQTQVYDKLNTPKNSCSFHPNSYSQFRKLYLCNELRKESGIKYDLVIKTRPDLNYSKPIILSKIMGLTVQDHYVNDLFYYGPDSSIDTLANIFLNLDLKAPIDTHHLICHHISKNKILIDEKKLGIELMRQDGTVCFYEYCSIPTQGRYL